MDELDLGATIRGFSAGQRVFGRFTLKKILGRGGMGVVWLAKDEKLDEELALKFLPDVVKHDAAALDELKAETKRARRLTHAGIVRIHDFLDDSHAAAIAMEAVEGVTLSQFRIEQPGKVFEAATVLGWLRQLCSALDYAHHTARVVHRDLKPANLMVDRGGQIKITDFGIARSISDSVSRASAKAGSSGTPAYMSPQQMLGEKPAVTDDIYGLGATLYELLTGKPPFHSGNVILQVQNKLPPTITERRKELEVSGAPVPPELEAVIAACLAKQAAERPSSMAEIARRLGFTDLSLAGKGTGESGPLIPRLPVDLDAGETQKIPRADQPIPTVLPKTAVSKASRYLAMAVGLAALVGAGYYFGVHVPEQEQKRIVVEQAKVAEENRLAEQRAAEQAAQAVAEEKRRIAEREDKAYQEIERAILGLAEAAPRTEFETVQKLVETYLGTAPERYRGPVAADWGKKAKAWLAYEAAHRPGSLVVETDPPGATVILYPANIRKTSPATFKDLSPGENSLRVEKEGYEPQDVSVVIKPDEETKPGVVRLISLTGSAVLTSDPAGATVSLDGNSRHFEGVTPWRQEQIPPGTYRATFQRANWRPVEKSLVVKRNESVSLAADLHGVALDIRSDPAGAQVTLNGTAAGVTPLSLTDQAPGEYQVGFAKVGYEAVTRQLKAESHASVNETLVRAVPKITRLVVFRAILFYAGSVTLKIDGEVAGKLSHGTYWVKELPAGSHTVVIRVLGREVLSRQVLMKEGTTTYLEMAETINSGLRTIDETEALGKIGALKPDPTSPNQLGAAGNSASAESKLPALRKKSLRK